jgi:hypothetical protein
MKYTAVLEYTDQVAPYEWKLKKAVLECNNNTTLEEIYDWGKRYNPEAARNILIIVPDLVKQEAKDDQDH